MTTHEVLVAARNLIDREGWGQGPPCEGPGAPYCAETACEFASDHKWPGALYALRVALGSKGVVVWNDTPGRSKHEVLDLFDRAIAATAPDPFVDLEAPEPVAA